mgnify:CR=1 FL=1
MQEREVFLATYSSLADHITAARTITKDKKSNGRLNFVFLLEALHQVGVQLPEDRLLIRRSGEMVEDDLLGQEP